MTGNSTQLTPAQPPEPDNTGETPVPSLTSISLSLSSLAVKLQLITLLGLKKQLGDEYEIKWDNHDSVLIYSR